MRFSQNRAWYPGLDTWYSLGKNHITSIFDILFPEGPVLFDPPRRNVGRGAFWSKENYFTTLHFGVNNYRKKALVDEG